MGVEEGGGGEKDVEVREGLHLKECDGQLQALHRRDEVALNGRLIGLPLLVLLLLKLLLKRLLGRRCRRKLALCIGRIRARLLDNGAQGTC